MFEWFIHQAVQGTCSQSNMHENVSFFLWCIWNGRQFQCFFGLCNTVQAVACPWRGSSTMRKIKWSWTGCEWISGWFL